MAIHFHPQRGTIVVCDFRGFEAPEMQKRRPVVVVSPRLRHRDNLCTVVPLSTTAPRTARLFLMFCGKDERGARLYDQRVISDEELRQIKVAILHGLGMSDLTGRV
jgi:uncharacterized protein YifN (PemK superfamily)